MLDTLSPTAAYAAWIAETPQAWPAASRQRALRAVIDTVAVMVPGARDRATATIHAVVRNWGGGPATVVGQAEGLALPWAALLNGTAAHALDFDDNFDPAKAHASAVLVPALLTLGDVEDAAGAALIDAYIVGLQILCRVGQAVNHYHRARGWHATATLGAVGAAAAAARLLRLAPHEAQHALSMSTSLAGGFMSQFGSMTKPLHAGLAAMGGVMAATLARGGVTAGAETLDGPHGLATLMVGPDRAALRDGLVGTAEHGQTLSFETRDIGSPLAIDAHGLKVKRYPNCGSIHRALDGLLELRARHGLTPDGVRAILVRAPAAHLANLMYPDPQTPGEARFSLEYALALGLVAGAATLADYEPEALFRPDIRAAMTKVRREPVDKLETAFPTEVIVTLNSGETVRTAVAMPVGSNAQPLSDAQLLDKFRGCVTPVLGADRSAELETALLALDGATPLRSVMARLRP